MWFVTEVPIPVDLPYMHLKNADCTLSVCVSPGLSVPSHALKDTIPDCGNCLFISHLNCLLYILSTYTHRRDSLHVRVF